MEKEKLIQTIQELKKAKNAIILAHYYQNGEIQEIADAVGDSYQLSVLAKNTNADRIIFCGVHFMAETAKILSPEKRVFLPVKNAGCYMANTIDAATLSAWKKEHPDYKVIGYVNTSAAVKALCDVCVTSANALRIIKHYQNQPVLYVPDQNLAKYANRFHMERPMEYWQGSCNIHHRLRPFMIEQMKQLHPEAVVMIHPEAQLDVLEKADFVGSTRGMLDYAKQSEATSFIVGTEQGILHALRKENPQKQFYLLSPQLVCHTMKMTTLEDVYQCLMEDKQGRYMEIALADSVAIPARKALEKMLELSK